MKTAFKLWTTDHGPRTPDHRPRTRLRAFSLIELLVVIGVITILAGLTFPIAGAVKRAQATHRAKAELTEIETAIESYHHKLGYYPPDNPVPPAAWATNGWALNPLYYELLGTTNVAKPTDPPVYMTLDGSSQIKASDLPTTLGANITGFMNCAQVGRGGDEAPNADNFLKGLKASQFMSITNASSISLSVLGIGIDGPAACTSLLGVKLSPWRYNSSNPQHNPKSIDLWVDITVGSKTYRICNWSDKPLVVSSPYPYPGL